MTLITLLGPLAGGFRLALVLFAVMLLYARVRGAWRLIALAAVGYSPAHAAWLLGHPLPKALSLSLDLVCSALACAGFILVIAESARTRGMSEPRVKRGISINVLFLVLLVAAAWLTR